MVNKNNIYIEKNVQIGKNVIIEPNNVIKGNSTIGDNSYIGYGNYINNCNIGNDCKIEYSHLTNSTIQNNVTIGPYTRIRPNCIIGNNCKLGNFVEIKNSILKDNVKASHLSYIGDTTIGKNCNIGCGAIFVNYDGKNKNRSVVGDNCFIGSNVNIIAPINISDGSYICAGTTLTINTNSNDFIIGRTREVVKPNKAKDYL